MIKPIDQKDYEVTYHFIITLNLLDLTSRYMWQDTGEIGQLMGMSNIPVEDLKL